MTFIAHGIIGAGICALPFRWCKDWWKYKASLIGAVFGFLGGICPDAFDWIAATFFNVPRWEYYRRMHDGDLANLLIWHPAYALHLYLDSFIHIKLGYDWWSDFWYLEIGCWIMGIFLIWFSFKERKKERKMTPKTPKTLNKTSTEIVHFVDLAEVISEIQKLTAQVLERVDEKILLNEQKFGTKILQIESELRIDIEDLAKFKKDYREGHVNLVNSVEGFSKQNAEEHGSIMKTLGGLVKGQEEIQRITSSARATIKAEDAWNTYKKETKVGRFIASRYGKVTLSLIGAFLLLSVLHSLGLKQVDPMGWVSNIFEKIFPGSTSI